MSNPSTEAPYEQFRAWFDQACRTTLSQPEAVALATATPDGRPSARMVLYRGMSGSGFRFFTNYQSRKGSELDANPRAALLFYWEPLGRQVRIEGRVERLDADESDAYFAARPRGHQLGAWASDQSRQVASLDEVRRRFAAREAEFDGSPVPRPPHWGGYRLIPDWFEFWTLGADRIHERVVYQRNEDGTWTLLRLAP